MTRSPLRIVEKTPENSFRIPFLMKLFPDALFLYVIRDPRGSISSIYRGWHQPVKFKTYPLPSGFRIQGYAGTRWSFGLPPGWRSLEGSTLMEVCAFQWKAYNEACLQDLPFAHGNVLQVSYEDLVGAPAVQLGICMPGCPARCSRADPLRPPCSCPQRPRELVRQGRHRPTLPADDSRDQPRA